MEAAKRSEDLLPPPDSRLARPEESLDGAEACAIHSSLLSREEEISSPVPKPMNVSKMSSGPTLTSDNYVAVEKTTLDRTTADSPQDMFELSHDHLAPVDVITPETLRDALPSKQSFAAPLVSVTPASSTMVQHPPQAAEAAHVISEWNVSPDRVLSAGPLPAQSNNIEEVEWMDSSKAEPTETMPGKPPPGATQAAPEAGGCCVIL